MAYSLKIREEELKNRVRADYFGKYENAKIKGNIDFCVADKNTPEHSYLWAEAKKGASEDILDSLAQLVLTIGRSRQFEKDLPPDFLGAFDAEKIAFLPSHLIMPLLALNDFNWNVAPSDHCSREFAQIRALIDDSVTSGLMLFEFGGEDQNLRQFIARNFVKNSGELTKIEVTRNNFIAVYHKWIKTVKDSILINWDKAREKGILDADFFLADLLSENDDTIRDRLFVQLRKDHYEFDRTIDEMMTLSTRSARFNDGRKVHKLFWNIYKRPPKEEFWDFIVTRKDLLVPQDVRERKGSYFTPARWVELSQKYLADTLGQDWQDEYVIWDCAAGTGNLLAGLTDKYKIWASTIDQSDVDIMKDRIENGANLLESHVFQFDFLNDSFDKLPGGLRSIVNDPEKRKKLLIYINPPYAEHGNAKQISKSGKNKSGVAQTGIYSACAEKTGTAARELYAQFLFRIYTEISGCKIGVFSKLKGLQAGNFKKFRQFFNAKLDSLFLMPAYTFDNVKGSFPVGFHIWDLARIRTKEFINADVYNDSGVKSSIKTIIDYDKHQLVIKWLRKFYDKENAPIGFLNIAGTDVQHHNAIFISTSLSSNAIKEKLFTYITAYNILPASIYYSIRNVIEISWLNDRDHFLYPAASWEDDRIFQSNCLVFALFSNVVRSADGVNHWIPFTEAEVNAPDAFESHFMSDYLAGKTGSRQEQGTMLPEKKKTLAPEIGEAARAMLDAGREVWKYYMSQPAPNVNASFYDIKEYFQGRDASGKLKTDSTDAGYNALMDNLKARRRELANEIRPKVYEHGFLLA